MELDFDIDPEVQTLLFVLFFFSLLIDGLIIWEDFSIDSVVTQDICIDRDIKKIDALPASKAINEQHIANRLQYSLRVSLSCKKNATTSFCIGLSFELTLHASQEYLSILYLRMSENFKIVLRGRVVLHRNLADDLKYLEYILYKPQSGGHVEVAFIFSVMLFSFFL